MSESENVKRSNGLADVIGENNYDVEIAGQTISISPFKLWQVSRILGQIDLLMDKGQIEFLDEAGKLNKKLDVTRLFLRGGDPLLEILQIATPLTREQVAQLDLIDGIKLIKAVWEMNVDFFDRHKDELVGVFGDVRDLLAQPAAPPIGVDPSNCSSEPVIG